MGAAYTRKKEGNKHSQARRLCTRSQGAIASFTAAWRVLPGWYTHQPPSPQKDATPLPRPAASYRHTRPHKQLQGPTSGTNRGINEVRQRLTKKADGAGAGAAGAGGKLAGARSSRRGRQGTSRRTLVKGSWWMLRSCGGDEQQQEDIFFCGGGGFFRMTAARLPAALSWLMRRRQTKGSKKELVGKSEGSCCCYEEQQPSGPRRLVLRIILPPDYLTKTMC